MRAKELEYNNTKVTVIFVIVCVVILSWLDVLSVG